MKKHRRRLRLINILSLLSYLKQLDKIQRENKELKAELERLRKHGKEETGQVFAENETRVKSVDSKNNALETTVEQLQKELSARIENLKNDEVDNLNFPEDEISEEEYQQILTNFVKLPEFSEFKPANKLHFERHPIKPIEKVELKKIEPLKEFQIRPIKNDFKIYSFTKIEHQQIEKKEITANQSQPQHQNSFDDEYNKTEEKEHAANDSIEKPNVHHIENEEAQNELQRTSEPQNQSHDEHHHHEIPDTIMQHSVSEKSVKSTEEQFSPNQSPVISQAEAQSNLAAICIYL